MRRTHSVDAVKDKTKRRAKVGKGLASKPRRKRTGISTYRRLAAVFRRRISSVEWQAGDHLPALDALVKELRVGRITVRHALDLLAEEGSIARHRDRRGSSVICQPLDRGWFTLALNLNELEQHSAAITVCEIDNGPWHRPLPGTCARPRWVGWLAFCPHIYIERSRLNLLQQAPRSVGI